MIWIVLSAILLLAAAMIFLALYMRRYRGNRVVLERIQPRMADTQTHPGVRGLFSILGRINWNLDPEIPRLLDQLGWRSAERRALFYSIQLGTPLAAFLLTLASDLFRDKGVLTLVLPLAALGVGYLLPKRWLHGAVKQRRARLAEDVATMLPLLRMLFEVGMSVEQSLRALMQEGSRVLPELALELRRVFNRVDAGLDLADELRQMKLRLEIDEISDLVVILEQLLSQGGGAVASLVALKELFDDRRMTSLQEKVSRLSAKMSAVMVAFLFPALLIILAGPGFIAIFGALAEIGK